MIDFETVRFMKMLDELTAQTVNGIVPFSKATPESWNSRQQLFFDDCTADFPIVRDACVDELHHDIVGYYGGEDYTVRLNDDDGSLFIEVASTEQKYVIVIEEGIWYFS